MPPKKTTITQPGRVLKKKHITITEAVHLRGSKPKKIYDQKSNDIMISAKKSSHNLLKKHEKEVNDDFDNKYGNVSLFLLLGAILISLGVIIMIINVLRG